jgi:hypothetical protein
MAYLLVTLSLIISGGLMVDKCTFNQRALSEISHER